MKKLKKILCSVVVCVFVFVFGMFSFSGCALVKTDNSKVFGNDSLTVGDKTFTRSELISQFYTYYQNNSSNFSMVSNDQIVQAFYTWVIVREIINQKAEDELYDPETNQHGNIVYTTDEEEEIWDNVNDYFFGQVSTNEKAIYNTNKDYNGDEKKLPAWLQTEEEEEEKTGFLPYESSLPEVKSWDEKVSKYAKKLTDEQIKAKAKEINSNLNKYNDKTIDDSKFIPGARNAAYAKYVETLVNNAKSSGQNKSVEDLFYDEVKRVYDAYYSSKITTLYQNYYVQNILLNKDIQQEDPNLSDTTLLADEEIARAYLNGFIKDWQNFTDEKQYITAITATSDTSLVLYHYNGQYYYFSVQHILVGFDDYMNSRNSRIIGYDVSNDKYGNISDQIKQERDDLVDKYIAAGVLLSKVNKDNQEDLSHVTVHGNYYYYDKEAVDNVLAKYPNKADNAALDAEMADADLNYGYIKAEKTEINGDPEALYFDLNHNGDYDEGEEITNTEKFAEDVNYFYMATPFEIVQSFNETYTAWQELVNEYLDADENERRNTFKELEKREKIDKGEKDVNGEEYTLEYDDVYYVFELIDNMLDANFDGELSADEIDDSADNRKALNEKLASMIFVELEWIYSSDSLGNEYSNKLGYVVSSETNNQGSWVTDFAEGARKLLNQVVDENGDIKFDDSKFTDGEIENCQLVSGLLMPVYSQYGVHIMKVENVFKANSTLGNIGNYIDLTNGTVNVDLSNSAVLKDIINSLKSTYVCASSNETLYQYYYDELYVKYAGNASTNGTYFLKKEYEWLSEWYGELQADGTRKDSKIIFHNQMSYDELMDAINM